MSFCFNQVIFLEMVLNSVSFAITKRFSSVLALYLAPFIAPLSILVCHQFRFNLESNILIYFKKKILHKILLCLVLVY